MKRCLGEDFGAELALKTGRLPCEATQTKTERQVAIMNQTKEITREQAIEKLQKLIHGIDYAMMTTVDDDGQLRSRPMSTQKTPFNGTLWFFTGASTHKVSEIAHDQHVNLSYADPDDNRYVSISGRAQLVRDKAKIKELWNPAYKAWFPGGLDDPDLALIKVEMDKAEYWDSPSSSMVHLFGFVKALVTGQPMNYAGENQKVKL
jgi:general stress protein 26